MIRNSWLEIRGRIPKRFFPALLLTMAVSLALFASLHVFDNKLDKPGPQARSGSLTLSDQNFEETPVMYLVDGWALYKNVLLTPEDLKTAAPDEYISIGDYTDMSFNVPGLSPHGSASYSLQIDVRAHEGDNIYTLQLPEIYSAYNLYINGQLMHSVGTPEPENYEPLILTHELNFKAKDSIEILFAVSDWSYFNSGLIDPPAFGDTLSVNTMVQGRLVWRSALLGAVLMLGIVIMLAGHTLERKMGILYLCLVLCFIGYTSYVIVHALTPSGMFWFWFQTFCFYAMFFLAIWLVGEICGIHTKLSMAVKIIDAAMCVLAIGVPLVFAGNYMPMHIFSEVSHYYKLFLLVYLTGISAKGVLRGSRYAHVIVCGMSVFWVSTVLGFIMPRHIAVLFGETLEMCCFIMICIIGSVLSHEAMTKNKEARMWRDAHYLEQYPLAPGNFRGDRLHRPIQTASGADVPEPEEVKSGKN